MKIRLLIAEELTLFREAFTAVLNATSDITVVASTGKLEEANAMILQYQPQLMILNTGMVMDSLSQIENLQVQVPVLGITQSQHTGILKNIQQSGIRGLVSRNASMKELRTAIHELASGTSFLGTDLSALLSPEKPSSTLGLLTEREVEVCSYISRGHTSREIAGHLLLSTKTIQTHRYNILKKLNIRNRAALVDFFNAYSLG